MKNQYCGDTRDLFKYDLVEHICKEMQLGFAFIPMLTPNDSRNDGNKRDFTKAKVGYLNEKLVEFLVQYHTIPKDKRDFRKIRHHYERVSIKIKIYEHDKNQYFTHRSRLDYFEGIKKNLLKHSLVFLDPDNGLETKNNKDKHILYSDVESIYEKMGVDSLLVIFQFKPREKLEKYLKQRSDALYERAGDMPLFISDKEVIFFILSKDINIKKKAKDLINQYKSKYPKLAIDYS